MLTKALLFNSITIKNIYRLTAHVGVHMLQFLLEEGKEPPSFHTMGFVGALAIWVPR